MNLRIYLKELEGSFDMEKAVCNHGFFMMAPNVWDPRTKSLSRPLTLSNSTSTYVTVSRPGTLPFLVVQVPEINNVSRIDEDLIFDQVRRMLRLSDDDEREVTEFQQLHEAAKEGGFGRIFRSPSLFEDMVKSILLCNTSFERSLGMASKLCDLQSKLADGIVRPRNARKRKRVPKVTKETIGNFPSAKELASLDTLLINEHCKLGYRGDWVFRLAQAVQSGKLINLEEIERREIGAEQIIQKLNKLKGFGAFATSTVLMCVGYYHLVPSDTETLRLLREVHGTVECSKETLEKAAQTFYDKYAPFQSLAYWYDLIQNYETKLGKLSKLSKSDYKLAAGCSAKKPLKGD